MSEANCESLQQRTAFYQCAILVQEGRHDEALASLRDSINHGLALDVKDRIGTDPDLDHLHGDPRFNTLVAEVTARDTNAESKKK